MGWVQLEKLQHFLSFSAARSVAEKGLFNIKQVWDGVGTIRETAAFSIHHIILKEGSISYITVPESQSERW